MSEERNSAHAKLGCPPGLESASPGGYGASCKDDRACICQGLAVGCCRVECLVDRPCQCSVAALAKTACKRAAAKPQSIKSCMRQKLCQIPSIACLQISSSRSLDARGRCDPLLNL